MSQDQVGEMGCGPVLSGGAQDTRPRQQNSPDCARRPPPCAAPLGAAVSRRLPTVGREPCGAVVEFGFRPSKWLLRLPVRKD